MRDLSWSWIGLTTAVVYLAGCHVLFNFDPIDAGSDHEGEGEGTTDEGSDADGEGLTDGDATEDGVDDGGACIPEECDDDNACNGEEVCTIDGRCVEGRAPDEGTPCTTAFGVEGHCFRESCRPITCGDGTVNSGEDCDDGNLVDDDGCDADCTFSCRLAAECDDGEACNGAEDCLEHACVGGEPAPDGTSCGPALICRGGECVPAGCGDGVVDPSAGEECDDANDVAGDGCEADCSFSCHDDAACNDLRTCNGEEVCDADLHRCAPGVYAEDGTPCLTTAGGPGRCREGTCAPAGCGDSIVGAGEECDDGNLDPDDGCRNDCTWTCTSDPACDDGRLCDGTEACNVETHTCAGGTPLADGTECNRDGDPSTRDICRLAACVPSTCGDAFLDPGNDEQCDDGNRVPGDGCDLDCTYSCASTADCDDGDACDGLEACDTTAHVCLPGGWLADGTACTRPAGGAGICRSGACVELLCGNGTVNPGEECDDGNTVAGDGCETTCRFSCYTAEECREVPDNPCTTDSCTSVTGGQRCTRTNNTLACDDANACTSEDTCSGGVCRGTAIDADADGYGPGAGCGGDCDDTDRLVHPGAVETCNGVDDDCSGATDDGPTMTCRQGTSRSCVAAGGCVGTESCSAATCTWSGSCVVTAAESCNGLDDDCDALTDEGFLCVRGATRSCTAPGGCSGTETCSTTCVWTGTCVVTAVEVCNAADDDCDTLTDETFSCRRGASEGCTRTGATGSCSGTRTCGTDCTWGVCVVTTTESCNGLDDDCDGVIDDGFACAPGTSESCTIGSCTGTRSCSDACAWEACVVSATESCNGLDDDCDGATDEGFGCRLGASESCSTTCGTTGTRTCDTGCVWGACRAAVETCDNGCDDDGDGATDEGCGGAIPCASDAACASSGLICNEEWGICVVPSCTAQPNFTPCETVTAPDRSYDICVAGTCVSPGCGDASCNAPSPNWPLNDTHQRTCYDNSAALGACPGTPGADACTTTAFCGQDAQYGWDATCSSCTRFTRTGDAEPVVVDEVTGLMWQGCLRGQSGAACGTGTAEELVWSAAVAACDELTWGGWSDWRLPSRYELASLIDFGVSSGMRIDLAAFPAPPSVYRLWTSSSQASNPSYAWYVYFNYGRLDDYAKTNADYVRCVRGGTVVALPRFVRSEPVPGSGQYVVSDTATGRIWHGCVAGMSGSTCTGAALRLTWQAAVDYCQDSTWAGFTDWYLPNIDELASLINDTRSTPCIDNTAFPGTPADWSFSSTTYAGGPSDAMCADFDAGALWNDYCDKVRNTYPVRCVRAP